MGAELSSLAASEFENLLSTRGVARRMHMEVLRILVNPSRWSDIGRG